MRVDWVAYDQLDTYWRGRHGGQNPVSAYRKYVEAGIESPEDPFKSQLREWVFGSEGFLRRMVALAVRQSGTIPRNRKLRSVTPQAIIAATAESYGSTAEDYRRFRSDAAGRAVAAWLCRRWTSVSLSQLGPLFGLSGTGSVSNLTRRGEKLLHSRETKRRLEDIEASLSLNIENKA